MIKKIVFLAVCFFSFSCVAMNVTCPLALPTTHKGFCVSFKAAASCYCSKRLPKGLCENMDLIYQRMIGMFGSIEKACRFQKETTTQNCIDDWNCYFIGRTDSQGGLCSSTGKSCIETIL